MREFDLLEHIYRAAGRPDPTVPIGPGDDMAVVRLGDRELLAAVDQVVEGRHFSLPQTPLDLVGRKAVTRSLSDVAAMAGRPLALLAAATLPADFGADRANELFDAVRAAARRYGSPLAGGDISIAPAGPLVLSVTVLAEPGPAGPVLRSGARPGDTLYVTGVLGGSLESGRHLTFEPRIEAALDLARIAGPRLHAMIDISDGLGRDAGHIAARSQVGIELDARRIPCTDGVGWRQAVADGEDYELCIALEGEAPGNAGGVPLTAVGRVVAGASVIVIDGNERIDVSQSGWEHGT